VSRGLVGALIAVCAATGVHAQQPELHVDVIGPRPYSTQIGVGSSLALGTYTRVTTVAAFAPKRRPDLIGDAWRFDLLGRVTLDPFRQQRWALAFAGGVSIRRRSYLAAIAELEGPAARGFAPALQVGVSGGLRAGVLIRRALANKR